MGQRTYWSGPVPPLNVNSVSPTIAAAITDVSPDQVILYPGMLEAGTRIRIRAYGEYVTSAATATLILGFYMTNLTAVPVSGSSVVIAATAATTVANTGSAAWPWMLEWEGQVRAITSPVVGATNAQLYGMGKAYLPVTNITSWTVSAIPITAALRTVQQASGGLITNVAQLVSVATTFNVTTAVTSFTCDELTVELLG